MDAADIASMQAQITGGVPKSQSRFVKDPESSRLWDQLVVDIADLRRRGIVIDQANEIPDLP